MCFIPIVQIIINKVQPTTAAAAAVGSKRNYIPNCLLKDVHTKSIDGSPENKNPKMTFQLLGISTMSCSLKNSAKLSNYFILLSYQTVSKNQYNWYVSVFANYCYWQMWKLYLFVTMYSDVLNWGWGSLFIIRQFFPISPLIRVLPFINFGKFTHQLLNLLKKNRNFCLKRQTFIIYRPLIRTSG